MSRGKTINEATRRFIAELDIATFEASTLALERLARHGTGRSTGLEGTLDLLGAARVLAAMAELGHGEIQAWTLLLSKYGVPAPLREQLLGLDASEFGVEEILRQFSPGSRAARHLFWVLASLASYEGLRDDVRERVERLGPALGLGADLARVVIEEAQASAAATLQGDDAALRRLRGLRYAIFDLGQPD